MNRKSRSLRLALLLHRSARVPRPIRRVFRLPPRGFFSSTYARLFSFPFYVQFAVHRFANVHRNSLFSVCKGRSLILPHFVRSDYHFSPCTHSFRLFQFCWLSPKTVSDYSAKKTPEEIVMQEKCKKN